jgi:hypothetical protein
MSTGLQRYEIQISFLYEQGLVHMTVSAYDEFHAARLAEMTFVPSLCARVESIKLVA